MMNILFIDTSDNKKTVVRLERDGTVLGERVEPRVSASQAVLPLIDVLLKSHDVSFSDISGIRVHTGPGSFTGLRVGAAVASALGWLLDIPVNGKKDHQVEPIYENSRW